MVGVRATAAGTEPPEAMGGRRCRERPVCRIGGARTGEAAGEVPRRRPARMGRPAHSRGGGCGRLGRAPRLQTESGARGETKQTGATGGNPRIARRSQLRSAMQQESENRWESARRRRAANRTMGMGSRRRASGGSRAWRGRSGRPVGSGRGLNLSDDVEGAPEAAVGVALGGGCLYVGRLGPRKNGGRPRLSARGCGSAGTDGSRRGDGRPSRVLDPMHRRSHHAAGKQDGDQHRSKRRTMSAHGGEREGAIRNAKPVYRLRRTGFRPPSGPSTVGAPGGFLPEEPTFS